jgi:PAS domain-containing protein
VLITGLGLLGYVTFTASESSASPLLLSSLVPFLLWAALRFGSRGTSSAVIVVTFLSIWAAVHGRGPFVERGPLSSMLSLQLFLILAATSFMVLAALVGERKRAEDELRESEARFRLAAQAGRKYAYDWDAVTDLVTRSGEYLNVLGLSGPEAQLTREQISATVHPDDRALFTDSVSQVTPENPASKLAIA